MNTLKCRILPVQVDAHGIAQRPVMVHPLTVDEVQITHTDIDHVGNAGELMKSLVDANMPGPIKLQYNYVPPASPNLTLSLAGAMVDHTDNTFFIMSWKIEGFHQWVAEIDSLDLISNYECRTHGWKFSSKKEFKDEANDDRFIGFKTPSTNLIDMAPKPAGFLMEMQLSVGEQLTDWEGTTLQAEIYWFNHEVDTVLAWVKHLLHPAKIPRNLEGPSHLEHSSQVSRLHTPAWLD